MVSVCSGKKPLTKSQTDSRRNLQLINNGFSLSAIVFWFRLFVVFGNSVHGFVHFNSFAILWSSLLTDNFHPYSSSSNRLFRWMANRTPRWLAYLADWKERIGLAFGDPFDWNFQVGSLIEIEFLGRLSIFSKSLRISSNPFQHLLMFRNFLEVFLESFLIQKNRPIRSIQPEPNLFVNLRIAKEEGGLPFSSHCTVRFVSWADWP